MKSIRTAAIFGATLPEDKAEIIAALESAPFVPVLDKMLSSTGFIPNPVSKELLTPLGSGFMFTLRRDEKTIPIQEIVRHTNIRTEASSKMLERPLTKEEKYEIKQLVMMDLAERAFIDEKYVDFLYHPKEQILILANTTGDLADIAMSKLIGALGKLETRTLHVDDLKNGLTTRLKAYIKEDDADLAAFGELQVGNEVSLKRDASKDQFDAKNVDLTISKEVREALDNGCQVTSIRLGDSIVDIRVGSDFKLSGMKWELPKIEQAEDEPEDPVHDYKVKASLMLTTLVGFITTMIAMFNKEPVNDAE